jgi:hypothetical protein
MSGHSIRFLHAGSFRLEATLQGLYDIPEHLAETLVNAPFAAAERVFASALREEVDFVILSGDLLDPTNAGPRAVAFLTEQFTRLAKNEIPVYWAASRLDQTDGWLSSLDWPKNVHLFSNSSVESIVHRRGELPIARICGRSWHESRTLRSSEFIADASDLPLIAVLHESIEIGDPDQAGVLYWGLGGSASASTPHAGTSIAHCPGSPQGLQPSDNGPHGCSLVLVDPDESVRTRMIQTDSVRWCSPCLNLTAGIAYDTVVHEMRSRIEALVEEAQRPLLVCWLASGLGRFDSAFARATQRDATLQILQKEFGYGSPAVWSVCFELESPHALRAEWCEEDSILGDFMRVVREYDEDDEKPLRLEDLLVETGLPGGIAASDLTTVGLEDRDILLHQAAVLGLDLLRDDDEVPH